MSSSCEVRPRRLSRQILLHLCSVSNGNGASLPGRLGLDQAFTASPPAPPSVVPSFRHSAQRSHIHHFACISLPHSPALSLSLSLLLSQRHRVYINDWRLPHRCRILDAPLRAINFRTHQASILAHALHTWQEQPRSHRTKQQPLYIHQNVCNGSLR